MAWDSTKSAPGALQPEPFAVAIVEPQLFARFGSSDAVNAALRAVVEAADTVKYPAKAKRSARASKRTAA